MKRSELHATFGSTAAFALMALVASAATAGDDFQVNTTTAGNQHYVDVAMDDDGGFLIAWTSNPIWQHASILGKRYDSDGNLVSGEYTIADAVAGEQQRAPQLCHRDVGGWVVIWYNQNIYPLPEVEPVLREGVFARFLAEDGTPASATFQVSSAIPSRQGGSGLDIGCLPGGGFFAAWSSSDQDGSYYGVFGRYVDGAGNLVGAEIPINTDTVGDQGNFGPVRVASSPAGKVVVMWSSNCPWYIGSAACPIEPDGSGSSAQARLFDASHTPGPEFRINTTTIGSQGNYALGAAFDDDEGFMIVFSNGDTDLSLCNDSAPCSDLSAQRYDATGAPVGAEMLVNSFIRGDQIHADIVYDGAGGYLVVWEHRAPYTDDSISALAGRHFGPDGTPSGADFLLTSNEPRDDREPSIAAQGGNYIVAWVNYAQAMGWKRSVHARRLSSELPVCPATLDGNCANTNDSLISMRDGGTGPGKIAWKWSADRSTASLAPNGGMTGYSLCIYDGTGALFIDMTAPPFTDCEEGEGWRGRNGRYRFKKRSGEAFQMRTLTVQNGSERTKILLKATGMGAPLSRMREMTAPLTAQLLTSGGECWQADYNEMSMRTHTLKARSR